MADISDCQLLSNHLIDLLLSPSFFLPLPVEIVVLELLYLSLSYFVDEGLDVELRQLIETVLPVALWIFPVRRLSGVYASEVAQVNIKPSLQSLVPDAVGRAMNHPSHAVIQHAVLEVNCMERLFIADPVHSQNVPVLRLNDTAKANMFLPLLETPGIDSRS